MLVLYLATIMLRWSCHCARWGWGRPRLMMLVMVGMDRGSKARNQKSRSLKTSGPFFIDLVFLEGMHAATWVSEAHFSISSCLEKKTRIIAWEKLQHKDFNTYLHYRSSDARKHLLPKTLLIYCKSVVLKSFFVLRPSSGQEAFASWKSVTNGQT